MKKIVHKIDGITLEAFVEGSGETIILLPAGGSDATIFKTFSPYLVEAGLRTIAVNFRGVAGSQGPVEEISLHELADDVASIIQNYTDGSAFVLGYAFGNRVARCLAVDHPDILKGIILLGAAGRFKPDPEATQGAIDLVRKDLSVDEIVQAAHKGMLSPSTSRDQRTHRPREARVLDRFASCLSIT